MFCSRKAQAATEFAVLGSLIIVAFAFLVNYSEKLNRQQAYIQQTFRAALKEARLANSSAGYTKVVFRRMPNVNSPMELGQLQSFGNSANVLWTDGNSPSYTGTSTDGGATVNITVNSTPMTLTRVGNSGSSYTDIDGNDWGVKNDGTYYSLQSHGVSKYQLNEAAAIDIPYRATPANTTEVNVNSFINNTNASTNLLKAEAGGIINTTKTLNAQDRLTADVTISGVPYNFEQELGDEGKYYPATGGITLQRSRDMQ